MNLFEAVLGVPEWNGMTRQQQRLLETILSIDSTPDPDSIDADEIFKMLSEMRRIDSEPASAKAMRKRVGMMDPERTDVAFI